MVEDPKNKIIIIDMGFTYKLLFTSFYSCTEEVEVDFNFFYIYKICSSKIILNFQLGGCLNWQSRQNTFRIMLEVSGLLLDR